ncbi:hypothetical protein AEQU3_02848 [Aequorivita antarctica]|nr:hypothetical protein AEQU3_02848 [Aequorivita antarctica]
MIIVENKFCRKKEMFSYIFMALLWSIYGGGFKVTHPKITIQVKE